MFVLSANKLYNYVTHYSKGTHNIQTQVVAISIQVVLKGYPIFSGYLINPLPP